MRSPLRALSTATIAAGIAVAVVAPASATPPAPPTVPVASASSGSADSSHTVTLITGDVVTLRQGASGNTATVLTADGRPAVARIIETGGDLFVYPEQTLRYVADGALDDDLFNVTELVADGYDDAHAPRLPLIVTYADAASSRRAVPTGAERVRSLSSIDGASVAEPRATSAQFWAGLTADSNPAARGAAATLGGGIAKIWLDGKVTASLADSTAQIGAPEVWAGGNTGEGVTVAVLDSGIDPTHPDLADRIADSISFVPGEDSTDVLGHGTHVASTIAGTGAASSGKERGVAPGAKLDVAKVLGNDNFGQDSWIIQGMEWAARDKGAKIISMSLGGDPSDGTDPMSRAVDSLSAETGALFVVAAGNQGANDTVAAPGSAASALTVGAVDAHDALAPFSSRGPRLGDHLIKPEITAPGVEILAARSSFMGYGEGDYWSISGTSMATPHVAGAAALLLHEHPELTAAQVKDGLVSTSKPTPDYSVFEAGNGRLDAVAATTAKVIGPGAITVDRDRADAKGVVRQPLTYTNLSDEPLTLALSVPKSTAPTGLFAVSAASLVVPARGTASVTLATTLAKTPTTDSLGAVVASVAGVTVARTALAVLPLNYTLTLTMKDQNGAPTLGTVELLKPDATAATFVTVDGSTTLHLIPGAYSAMTRGTVEGVHGPNSLGTAIIGTPDITLTKNTTVALDFSRVRQVETTVPQVTRDAFGRLEYFRRVGTNSIRSLEVGTYNRDSLWTVPTGPVTHGEFDLTARWRKEQPEVALSTDVHDYTDATRQTGATQLPQGSSLLKLVFAGTGSAAEVAAVKAKGSAVVVRRDPSAVADGEQAAAAAAAGAKLLIVAGDQPGVAVNGYAGADGAAPIEVVAVSPDEGDRLIAEAQKKNAKATITSTPKSAYVYDVVQRHHNQIPQNLIVHEDKRTLARIDEDFSRAAVAPFGTTELRYDLQDYDSWAVAVPSTRPLATKRVDWASVGDGWLWGQDVTVLGTTAEQAPRLQYPSGSRSSVDWFAPITRPYLNNSATAPYRSDDVISIDVPGFGGGDHVGLSQSESQSQTVALYQGSRLVDSSTGSSLYVSGLSSAALPYRFVTKTTRTAEAGDLSPTTTTQWNFTSGAPTSAGTTSVLPLTQLLYGITANKNGVVKNESTVSITPQKLAGAVGAGSFGKPTVALSYDDGATWRSATVSRGPNGSWTVPVEALLHTKFVSIRTDLADSKGNAVSQTVIRAFGVR
ncbi:MAG: S8 family serine peptidase [Lacisediminihabitans sp.]